MSLTINTNINSLTAQNNLNRSQSALSQATERLSSGLKINSATDNAAGYAIANRFTTQIGGLGQASSNASDAINLAQTTQSALSQVTANLQAIRDLAVQSANGSYSTSDRQAINTEVQQRLAEVTRIANQTDFNGQKVLDGSLGTLSFQVGANVGQTISMDVSQSVKASKLGAISTVNTGNLANAFVNNTPGGAATTIDLSKITINGTAVGQAGDAASSVQGLADAINAANISGVTAAIDTKGGLSVFSNGALTIADSGSTAGSVLGAAQATGIVGTTSVSTQTSSIASGAYASGTALAAGNSLQGADVTTVDNSNALISRLDVALNTVSTFNSTLGAMQNRFQSTMSTLSAEQNNLSSSRSTIQDANFAVETANLSKANILQQAGIAVLAQANSQPQQVLKLLQ